MSNFPSLSLFILHLLEVVISLYLHCIKSARIRSYSGWNFPAFNLNTERYSVALHVQSEWGKMWTRIALNTDTFHAVLVAAHNSCPYVEAVVFFVSKKFKLHACCLFPTSSDVPFFLFLWLLTQVLSLTIWCFLVGLWSFQITFFGIYSFFNFSYFTFSSLLPVFRIMCFFFFTPIFIFSFYFYLSFLSFFYMVLFSYCWDIIYVYTHFYF